jgi:IPT/TIG domain.
MTVIDPEGGATLRIEPASPDGFYLTGSQVNITADPKVGFKFRRWDGDLSGTDNSGSLSMSSPRVVRALLSKVPVIVPGGVRNAATGAPDCGVAAGSLITIYGGSLAAGYEVGPSNPLAQSVGDVAVQVNDRYLPIIFVSAEQINAQLPSDLAEGSYTLTVKPAGLAEITAPFTVVRNAPGLFSNQVDSKSYALALHEDGSAITLDSPARRSETITFLGTGFGPYDRRVVDGFNLPENPVVKLADAAELVAAGITFQPAFAGAAPGYTGVAATRFKLPKEVPGATSVEMKIRVNGKESNTVLLPVE